MDANHHHPDMEHNTGALFPPLGQSPQQRAKTAHTTSSLPIAGNARVSTHPLLPPHHIKRRNQVHLHLHKQPHRGRHHARNKTDSPKAPCSMTDHIVGLYDAPELPEIEVLLRQGAASRATIVQMIAQGICRTSFNDVQRFPAIHPSIMSARKDRIVRYITFVSAPPFERRAPKDRPKSWDRRVFKPLGPEECFHCQLQTNHAVCERHKYLRVGGGFRHSYSYIKQTLDIMEAEHRKVAEEVRKRYEEEQLAMKAKAQTRRKIKMYVKGADGKIVSRYLFVTEDEYEEMKKDNKLAKKILGLADDEELDDWVSSKQKYVMDEKGQLVKVSKKKYGDSAYEESMESGIGGRSRRNKGRHHGAYSDSDSFESGMGHSILEGDEADRRRRRRHGRRRYSSVESIESYVSEGGTRQERTVRRRRRRRDSSGSSYEDENGNRRRRHRRRRRRGSGSDSGTELDSNDSRSRRRRHRKGRHRGRHHDGDSDGSYDSYDSRDGGGRRRRRRGGRRGSYSSGSDDSRSRRKGRRHRRRYSSSYSDESGAEGGKGRRRKGGRHRRHRRGHSSGSSDYSDSEDSSSYSDGSSYDSYDDSSVSLSDSSVVSDASTPSSVNSSDISDIDSNLDEDERIRIKAEKKAKKMLEKRAAKQQLKEETRKEAREVKRDKIRAEVKEQRREERRERRRKEKRRRQRTPTSRDISACSSVSSVNSDDISDVDSALVGEERRLAKEAKKAKKKAQKKEMKQKEKVKNVQEQHREKRKEKERQRIKREIEREMDRMSTPSDVSSVHSSDLSSVSDEEGLTAEEKQARKEERKKKKKEEKMKEKKLMKAVNKVMEKRKKKGRGHSGSSDDSYARGKQDFYDLTSQVVKSMVKYSKGGKRGLVDEEGSEWLDDWKNQKTKDGKKKKGKKGKAGQEDGDFIELTAPDGRKIRVPKTSLFDVWNMKKKIRLKKDGTVARDSDSDAESIEIDSDGNMVTQPKTVTFADTSAGKWTGFATTPEPPLSPTQGGKIKFQGVRKVQHAFRKDRGVLTEHLKRVLDTASELSYPRPGDREEARRGYHQNSWESIDFLNHYRLVEGYKLDPLGRAFVVEDVDYDCTLTAEEMRSAIEGVPSLSSIKPKQLEYVLRVLNIDEHTDITFKMFAVISGVCERMCNMDSFGKYILDKTNLLDIARKMALYKNIFYCNVNSERSVNHITSESLQIELIAGGLSPDQERYIMSKMNPDEYGEISFFDYMAYIPLFLSMHENIIDNPLDRHEKFTTRLDYGEVQRDMNPMGLPLQRGYLGVPKEIFPSGIPPRSPEDGATREFIERGDLLEDMVVGGKSGRLPSIGKKTSAPISAKQGGRMKDLGLSMSMP
ncbi:uncharacterized protein LOC117307368 [Asterias rubens]|uniref:uncharacterized protein LOC117307368 n=1 Tax=Asterias rubens TaxID=7604 RepID=UPI0014550735|nr:uncharacterized protein LOC117307368 [Asterias rubens]